MINIVEILDDLKNDFIEGYKENVDNRYSALLQSNSESFPLYHLSEENLYISLVKLNDTFFTYPNIVIISNKAMKIQYDFSHQKNDFLSEEYTDYINQSEKYVIEYLNIVDKKKDIIYALTNHGSLDIEDYDIQLNKNYYLKQGRKNADSDYVLFEYLSKEKMNHKSHDKVSPFNHLNLEDMMRVVNDDTFTYQIEQGLVAYKLELYLPAAATFAVAIESFLVKLKRVNGIKHKDSDITMYDKLLESLKQEKKITYRAMKRIEVAYSMRNIINHTQAGAVAKADCDFFLTTLKDLVDENQEKFNTYHLKQSK
ncbi:hypothetical protein [Macrococcoides bohemicum]|uniref:hypothetical protein n=1 Tax=Macrococcoides bohemicum TaxID=1903056 RepID=UPI0028A1C2F6|nr:hypothetical protein [Macrococcus bohemicus]